MVKLDPRLRLRIVWLSYSSQDSHSKDRYDLIKFRCIGLKYGSDEPDLRSFGLKQVTRTS